jgi:hypothetical protein
MRNVLLSALLGFVFCMTSASAEDVAIHARPPKVTAERRPPSLGPEYVWIDGYQRWNGSKYTWQAGHWEMPPHEHAIWMAPRWQRRHEGYFFMEGWWE